MKDLLLIVAVCAAAGLFLRISYLMEQHRSTAVKVLAAGLGFQFLGEGVPRSLSLQGSPFERATRIWNVIDGDRLGIRVIAFDGRIGQGKRSWSRTVIAINSKDGSFAMERGLSIARSGDWTIFMSRRKCAAD
jgi:hypothetical protein